MFFSNTKENKHLYFLKAHAISQQIGYPDYLGSDNNTRIEQDFKAVNEKISSVNNDIIVLMFSMNSIHHIFIIF